LFLIVSLECHKQTFGDVPNLTDRNRGFIFRGLDAERRFRRHQPPRDGATMQGGEVVVTCEAAGSGGCVAADRSNMPKCYLRF
jgi:hypothetical protein